MNAIRGKAGARSRATIWLVVAAGLSAVTALIAIADPGGLVERHVRGSFPAMTTVERAQEVQGLTSFVIVVGVLGLAFALWSRRRVRLGRPALRVTVLAALASAAAVVAAVLPGAGQRSVLPLTLGVSAGAALAAGLVAVAVVARTGRATRRLSAG